ncbi:MAG: gamma-glutamylcyclotransferase family protein [Chitinophagaceae bacterium]
MASETPYLFVYGTLRTSIDVPVKQEIAGHLEKIGESQVPGKLYDMGGYPAAVPAGENENSFIKGEVLKVNEPEKVFAALDNYEGFYTNDPDRSTYLRKEEEVMLPDGTKVKAWVYWYNLSVEGKPRINFKDYLEYLESINKVY